MRKLLSLALAAVSILGLMLLGSGTASATGEWLGCRISPGSQFNFTNPCQNTGGPDANGKFGVAFMVQNETVASSYSWAPAPYPVYSGCAATTNWCTLLVPSAVEREVEMSVTLVQGGVATQTLSATAYIFTKPPCFSEWCPPDL